MDGQRHNQNEGDGKNEAGKGKEMPRVSKKTDLIFALPCKKLRVSTKSQSEHNSQSQYLKINLDNEGVAKNCNQQESRKEKERQKQKSNKNPLDPIKQTFKMFEDLEKRMSIETEKMNEFGRFNNQARPKQLQIRLEECLTLKMVKKLEHGGCIKKVLHVPKFKVYLVQERPITNKDDKLLVQNDLKKWNLCPPNSYQLKNLGLFWNTPEQFMSLLYEYSPGYSLEELLHSVGFLPEQALAEKLVEIVHMVNLFQKEGMKYPKISSSQMLVSSNGGLKVRPNLNLGVQKSKEANSMVYQIMDWIEPENERMRLPLKVGLLCLYLSLGVLTMQEEIQEAIMNFYLINTVKTGCCLLHKLQESQSQLPLFQISKRKWTRNLQDFMCRCLSFDRKKRMYIQQMKNHPLLTQKQHSQKVQFADLLQLVKSQNTIEANKELQEGYQSQLNRVSEAIQMILSNLSSKVTLQLPIRVDDPTLSYLEEDIGLDKGTIMQRVNRTYAQFR